MVDLRSIFPKDFFTTLEKSSEDTDKHEYMVNNDFEVLKIDDYTCNAYQKKIHATASLKSGDACFERNGMIYIIEFKNRYITTKVKFNIFEKMYGSNIVLMDELDFSINEIRNKVNFVTVYTLNDSEELNEKYTHYLGISKLRTSIASRGTRKIKNVDTEAYGLKKLEKNIYHEVSTIPVQYFQRYLKEENII